MSLCSIFSFHSFIPYLPCSLKSSEASFIFFHHLLLSHQALISPIFLISPHLSSSHLPAKPKPSSSPAPVPAVAVASPSPSPSQHRALSSSETSYFFFIISSSHLSASPSPSQPLPSLSPAHARHQPTSGQCSLFFSSEFFNCCFGLIFLDLVLFCGENWCCPYVILGKIKKTFVLELNGFFSFLFFLLCT